jgi:hypothetical protein
VNQFGDPTCTPGDYHPGGYHPGGIIKPERINGFATGDRVAIVDGVLKGAYGKIYLSKTGCNPHDCRTHCMIVWVELSHIPENIRHDYGMWAAHNTWVENIYRFMVQQVTHID